MTYVKRLIWNEWNINHITRHNVTPKEVEEVCHSKHAVREGYKGRLMIIGPTKANRMLTVILEEEDRNIYYPVTARLADRKERKDYLEEIGGGKTI